MFQTTNQIMIFDAIWWFNRESWGLFNIILTPFFVTEARVWHAKIFTLGVRQVDRMMVNTQQMFLWVQ